MSVITISRGTYSRGKEIAEKVAKRLNYECIARETILEASKEFNIPEIKLVGAIHNAPSILDRFFSYGKEKFVAYFQTAFLEHMKKDNIVYHGLAGHFFLKGVSHALKVRIIADIEDRVKLEMQRKGIPEKEAREFLIHDDLERVKWSQALYGIDTTDASLYDLVIHLRKITEDDAVDIICRTAGLTQFKTNPQSCSAMDDLLLSARVKSMLINMKPDIDVTSKLGIVDINTFASHLVEHELARDLESIAKKVPDVKEVRVSVRPLR